MGDLVGKSGLGDRTILSGWRDDVPELMRVTDTLIMAAQGEGLGRVITQAMPTFKTVVVPNSGAIPEIVVHDEKGYMVPYANVECKVADVRGLLAGPAQREKIGQRGRSRLQEHSVPEIFVRRTEEILESAIH